MSDITKCHGDNCPVKEDCYRFTAKPDEYWQSWFTESPIENGKCDMYWGPNGESIWNQLKDIVKGDENVQ
jgi:hypothetical protein